MFKAECVELFFVGCNLYKKLLESRQPVVKVGFRTIP